MPEYTDVRHTDAEEGVTHAGPNRMRHYESTHNLTAGKEKELQSEKESAAVLTAVIICLMLSD